MTRTPFDQFAKALVIERESPFGRAEPELELPGDALSADLAWTPDRRRLPHLPRDALDRMAVGASLWEFFHKPPTFQLFLVCVQKLLAWNARRVVEARPAKRGPVLPHLWMVSAGVPASVMLAHPFRALRGWPRGFYAAPPRDAIRLVIVSQLPRTRDTLLLRLMGARRTLRDAINELRALPVDAPERMIALPHLVRLRITAPAAEDAPMNYKEFLAITDELVAEHDRAIREQALAQGRADGRADGLALLQRQFSRKLGRALSDHERGVISSRLDTVGPDRLGDVVLDLDAAALSAWLADPDPR